MSSKGKHKKNARRSRRNAGGRKRAVARINYGGLKIEVPPELDLPAGAPFTTRPQPQPAPSIPVDIQKLLKPLSAAATNAWRAKTKMTDPATGEPLEEMRRVYRFVEGVLAALGDAGVRVLDPTGKTYDSGMALKVLSFERIPGLGREEVIETIRPSVVWQDRLLQMGEVIVGTPEIAEQDETTHETTASDQPEATADQETVSTEAAAVSDGASAGAMSGTHESSDLTDGQETMMSASPVAGEEIGESKDTPGKRQFGAQTDADLTVSDVPARENSVNAAHDAASNQSEGAHDD